MMDDIPSFGDAEPDSTERESVEREASESESSEEQDENDYDDSILDDAFDDVDAFSLEQEIDGEEPNKNRESELQQEPEQQEQVSDSADSEKSDDDINELGDVPGLDDWLSGESDDDIEDEEIFDELDSAEFDELLESLEADTPADSNPVQSSEQSGDATQESQSQPDLETEPAEDDDTFELDDAFELDDDDSELDDLSLPDIDVDDVDGNDSSEEAQDASSQEPSSQEELEQKSKEELKLDNPDLDLEALLNDVPSVEMGGDSNGAEDFLDVEALMDDGDDTTFNDPDSQPLDLDVSLSDFTGVNDTDSVIDIDKDAGQNANLDLARAYLEMEDVDAAKELLEEVMREGSEEQKQEADTILKSID